VNQGGCARQVLLDLACGNPAAGGDLAVAQTVVAIEYEYPPASGWQALHGGANSE
jgi:hypothetical protein